MNVCRVFQDEERERETERKVNNSIAATEVEREKMKKIFVHRHMEEL